MTRRLLLGAAAWGVFLVAARPAPFSTAWVHAILLFAALALLPPALELLPPRESRPGRLHRWAVTAQLPAALLLTLSCLLSRGWVAASLAAPWLVVTVLVALAGLRRLLRHRPLTAARLCVDAGALFLAVGGAWTFADRLGYQPLGFAVVIVALTAVHFHYAGLLLPLLTGLAAERSGGRAAAVTVVLVVAGVPAVAFGITATQLALGPWIETAAAWLMAAGGTLSALLHLRLAADPGAPRPGRPVRALWAVAGASLLAGMVLAALYGSRTLLPTAWLRWLDVGWMQVSHGVVNALGFGLAGVTAWRLDAGAGSDRPSP